MRSGKCQEMGLIITVIETLTFMLSVKWWSGAQLNSFPG